MYLAGAALRAAAALLGRGALGTASFPAGPRLGLVFFQPIITCLQIKNQVLDFYLKISFH